MEKRVVYNYRLILKNLVQYLPSRVVMILNSFLIIPLFTHLLNPKEVSIYLIALQLLNLICTCSFDWISKATLRFYEKYNLQNKLEVFLSTVFWVSVCVYVLILGGYILFKNILLTKFAVSNLVFVLTLVLVIPCGIRQFIYQILRLKNLYWLYTISIIVYQFIFIVIFLGIVKLLPNAAAIVISMTCAIVLIDVYMLSAIHEKYKISFFIDKNIVYEILKYALPLILTNVCYWSVFHSSKLIFQFFNEYLNTSVFGIAWSLASNTITPLAGLFMFVNFPIIIKNFERKKFIKPYSTNVIQLYLYILFPVICGFCFFSKEITSVVLPQNYESVALLFPFFIITVFLHELMKLINIKYHLNNKIYIEMFLGAVVVFVAFFLNIYMISKYSVLGAAIVILLTETCLISINLFTKFKDTDYVNVRKIIKSFALLFFISIVCYLGIDIVFSLESAPVNLLKLIIFFFTNYGLLYVFRKSILT